MNTANIITCAWCDTKREVDFPTGEESHGMCPDCYEKESEKLKEYYKTKEDKLENVNI